MRRQVALLLLGLLLAGIGSPESALANSTPSTVAPSSGGLVVPSTTSDVRIERETLSLDFTSGRTEAQIAASYELVNVSGRDAQLDLLFIAPGGRSLEVALDGVPVDVAETANAQLPAEWLASDRGIDPRSGDEYEMGEHLSGQSRTRAWAFRIAVPAGARKTLTASYRGLLGYDRTRADHVLHHLVYVLGPARNWAGVGELRVTVTAPSDLLVATSPPLPLVEEADGVARYAATFDGIPADLLRVSTMVRPSPLDAWVEPVSLWLPFLPGLALAALAGVLCSRIGKWVVALVVAGGVAYGATAIAGTALLWMTADWLFPNADELSNRTAVTYISIFSALVIAPFCSSVVAAIWAGVGSGLRGRQSNRGAKAPTVAGRAGG